MFEMQKASKKRVAYHFTVLSLNCSHGSQKKIDFFLALLLATPIGPAPSYFNYMIQPCKLLIDHKFRPFINK